MSAETRGIMGVESSDVVPRIRLCSSNKIMFAEVFAPESRPQEGLQAGIIVVKLCNYTPCDVQAPEQLL